MSHIERIREERLELCKKLDALNHFIDHNELFMGLTLEARRLMRDQAAVMRVYDRILWDRLIEAGVALS